MGLTRIKNNQVDTVSPQSVIDADLKNIGELSGHSGWLKKVADNSWVLDNSIFLTAEAGSGLVIQTVSSLVAATSGTTTVTLNNTLPAITAGVQIWTGTITPAATESHIYISGSFGYTSGTSSRQLFAFLFRGNTCIGTTGAYCSTANLLSSVKFDVIDSPNTTSATTYSIRVGGASAHTWRINQLATPNFAGTLATSRLVLQELA